MPPRRPTEPTDPLADLRDADEASPPPTPAEPEPEPSVQAIHDEDWHARAVSRVVNAWHSDPTAQSFGHGGGTCACGYLARTALIALHGVPVQRQEPADG